MRSMPWHRGHGIRAPGSAADVSHGCGVAIVAQGPLQLQDATPLMSHRTVPCSGGPRALRCRHSDERAAEVRGVDLVAFRAGPVDAACAWNGRADQGRQASAAAWAIDRQWKGLR